MMDLLREWLPSMIILSFIAIPLIMIPGLSICNAQNECTINDEGNLTLFITNTTTNMAETGCICLITTYYSNHSAINIDSAMVELNNGVYYYTLSGNETQQTGYYEYFENCSKDDSISQYYGEYEIVEGLANVYYPVWNQTFMEWNSTIYESLEPKIDDIWTNIMTAGSALIQNIFTYLDDRLNVIVSSMPTEGYVVTENGLEWKTHDVTMPDPGTEDWWANK